MSLEYKVYSAENELIAACRYPTDAAAAVSIQGNGTKVRHGGRIVWTEGKDGFAGESYDGAANKMIERIHSRALASYCKANGLVPGVQVYVHGSDKGTMVGTIREITNGEAIVKLDEYVQPRRISVQNLRRIVASPVAVR